MIINHQKSAMTVLASFLFSLLPFDINANKPFTYHYDLIENAIASDRSTLFQGQHINHFWTGANDTLVFQTISDDSFLVEKFELATAELSVVASDNQLRSALSKSGIKGLDTLKLTHVSDDISYLYFSDSANTYRYSVASKTIKRDESFNDRFNTKNPKIISDQFPTTFGNLIEAQSPNGEQFITVKNHNLYLRNSGSDDLRQLTFNGTFDKTWVNTQESAQSFNVFWSPDSSRIATLQLDTTDVWHEPTPNWLSKQPEITPVAYPRAGEPIHRFLPRIIDVITNEQTPIILGNTKNQYVDILEWNFDGTAVYVQVIDRENKNLRIFKVDASTGVGVVVLQEKRDTYIDTPMTLSPKLFYAFASSDKFIYLSERSGWRHIELYEGQGKKLANLTDGNWEVNRIVGIDEEEGEVYFMSSKENVNPYLMHLHKVNLETGETNRLTTQKLNHRVEASPNLKGFLSISSSIDEAPKTEIYDTDGNLLRTLASTSSDTLDESGFGGVELFKTKDINNQWDMYGVILKPYNFDPQKKYPVAEYIYGGMQFARVNHTYYQEGYAGSGRDPLLKGLLRSGVIVVVLDAPGTPGRGREFQDYSYGIWPQNTIDNHVKWIKDAAKNRPWINTEKVAIWGHSWGGYMAQRAMIDAPGFFKAAVSSAAPSDFYDHPTYIEPFMGLPKNNIEGYRIGSNLLQIEKVQGPILSMPNPFDVNAGFSPGLKLVQAMTNHKKEVELFITPAGNHNFSCCSHKDNIYRSTVALRFLLKHLN